MDGGGVGWVGGGYFLLSFGGFWSSSDLTFALSLHHMFSFPLPCDETPPGLPLVPIKERQMSLRKCVCGGGEAKVSCPFSKFG